MSVRLAAGSLGGELLALLMDGPSSLAALYGALVLYCGYPRRGVVATLDTELIDMERRGWVTAWQMTGEGTYHQPSPQERVLALNAYEAWLPEAEFGEFSWDEVGLWYEITPEGREECQRLAGAQGGLQHPRWMLDVMIDPPEIVVHAVSEEAAEEALGAWLSTHPDVEVLHRDRTAEPVPEFRLRNGTIVRDGVRTVYRYRRVRQTL